MHYLWRCIRYCRGSANGTHSWLRIGTISTSIAAWMLFYVPIYAGILYQYRGSGYIGLIKAILYMIVPVFLVLKMPATMIAGLLLISMLVLLTLALLKNWFLPEYQLQRIRAVWPGTEANASMSVLHSIMEINKWFGNSGIEITETLPEYNTDYILTYLSSTYGMVAVLLLCSVLTVLIITVFHVALKQKNQLGMLMGCGCGMVLSVSFLINVLENLKLLPQVATFLPFLSAGGSYIVVSYALLGIVLSIYRYKNIYPQHIKMRHRTIKMTIGS